MVKNDFNKQQAECWSKMIDAREAKGWELWLLDTSFDKDN